MIRRLARAVILPTISVLTVAVLGSALVAAQAKRPAEAVKPTVAPAALKPLLPAAPAGWTRATVDGDKAVLTDTCSYTFAYATYTNNGSKLRLTIADTGFDEGALGALATMIMVFPDNHVGQIPPSTSITRLKYKNSSAAALWDAANGDAEFTVLVGGRFVVKAEGTHVTESNLPRGLVDLVNLDALAALK